MSTGQLLLTMGIALWVFDAKKIPQLVSNVVVVIAAVQRYYAFFMGKCDELLGQELHKLTLERNEKKARQVEANHSDVKH